MLLATSYDTGCHLRHRMPLKATNEDALDDLVDDSLDVMVVTRGLHSSTFQLNLSRYCAE